MWLVMSFYQNVSDEFFLLDNFYVLYGKEHLSWNFKEALRYVYKTLTCVKTDRRKSKPKLWSSIQKYSFFPPISPPLIHSQHVAWA